MAGVRLLCIMLSGLLLLSPGETVYGRVFSDNDLTGAVGGVHDPSMIRQGDTWYVFGSGGRPDGWQLPIICSTDLIAWRRCGHVFESMPEGVRRELPSVHDLWAPDVSYVDGEYRVYYAFSILGKNSSGIGLVTNKTLDASSRDFGWNDQGFIVESKQGDDFNTIDPNFFRDDQSRDWLVFGSFWSGIKMRRLDADGRLSTSDRHMYSLAARQRPSGAADPPRGETAEWQAIEAPFLLEHEGYFYLFTSWDHCCRGAESDYKIMVGRASRVTGPYVDQAGRKLTKGGGTLLLSGNPEWAGPGGESFSTDADGRTLMAFHAYSRVTGRVSLHLSRITWIDHWPQVIAEQP